MLVSVLVPTYKRLALLKRAVADVRAQTYNEWELIVSDDEVGEGETWQWLMQESASDSRIRVIKNLGDKHGQVFNVNNGLRVCKGEWIKPLFDDDRMLPNCLERMVSVAEKLSDAAMIGCRAQKWRDGQYVGDEKDFAHGEVDVIRSVDAQRAILMYDRWNGRTPTHMMIRKDAIDAGAYMPTDERYKIPVDWVWFARILAHGDYAMMRDVLVHQREGEVSSITGGARNDEIGVDRELFMAYLDIYNESSYGVKRRLSWRWVESEINGVRGIYHLKCGRIKQGLCMVGKMLSSFHGTIMTGRWLLQETFPSHFPATKRYSFGVIKLA